MVLVMTSSSVLSISRGLQKQSNCSTPGKLLGSSFNLFLHITYLKLRPEAKFAFTPNFKNYFLNFGPSLGSNGNFTILSALNVSIFPFSYTERTFFIYSLMTFSKTVLLYSFQILFIELNICLNNCAVHRIKFL